MPNLVETVEKCSHTYGTKKHTHTCTHTYTHTHTHTHTQTDSALYTGWPNKNHTFFEIPYFCSHYRYNHAVFAEVFRITAYQYQDGTGRLHKLRKQLNIAFLLWYYVFSILITSFALASKSQKMQISRTGCILDHYPLTIPTASRSTQLFCHNTLCDR